MVRWGEQPNQVLQWRTLWLVAAAQPGSAMSRSRSAGFTLIEVLLATMLLVGGLALAFATLRSASAVSQRGQAIAQRSERVRAVEEFLRRRLAAALPIAMGIDPQSQQPMLFIGEPQRLRFAADVPDYLGRGGPYLHDLSVAGDGEQRTLRIALTMLHRASRSKRAPRCRRKHSPKTCSR